MKDNNASQQFITNLLGRLELDKINGKKKLDYFRDKFMDNKNIKTELENEYDNGFDDGVSATDKIWIKRLKALLKLVKNKENSRELAIEHIIDLVNL